MVIRRKRVVAAVLITAGLTLAPASAAFAGGGHHVPGCNSGNGNGSEGAPDCDPGNSGGNNNGGD